MIRADSPTVLAARPQRGFVETPFIRSLVDRALAYIAAGYPVHFRGPSGSGKTTLAMHVAQHLGRPIMLIAGDDEFGSSDLVGGHHGYRRRRVIDNFVHSVLKTEEDVAQRWVDNRLTIACREGLTLIYDEFNRSPPEANNVLLSVLEEKLLMLSGTRNGSYLKVHPHFVAIFTSNPEDYAGVHRTQDALRDRMVTLDLEHFDRDTEVEITHARSGIPIRDAEKIVDLVRDYREAGVSTPRPSIRGCIMLAKVAVLREARVAVGDPIFEQICVDILSTDAGGWRETPGNGSGPRPHEVILALLRKHCSEIGHHESLSSVNGVI